MSLPWDWLSPILLLGIFGGFAMRAAVTDRTPRRPEMEWWHNRPSLDWWAQRPHAITRRRWAVRRPRLHGAKEKGSA